MDRTPHQIALPPGMKVEFTHRYCPRCGLDLTRQVPEAKDDEKQPDNIEQRANDACTSRVSGNFEVDSDAFLQRMVAPLTESEKEHAQRNEQRWLRWQNRQQSSACRNEHGQTSSHQHLVPMVESKFLKGIRHAWNLITGK